MMSLALGACASEVAAAQTLAEIDDAATRMQYAFYTADIHALQAVLHIVEELQVDSALASARSYQLAYGHWKLSQLFLQPVARGRAEENARSLASTAAQACVRHARSAAGQDAAMIEALAIQAACEGHSPAAPAGSAGCADSKPLRSAVSAAPANPRVKLIHALCVSGATAADPAASERWRNVVAAFEMAPPSRPGRPDWGHVEALTMLGEAYLRSGDALAARDALERALVLAPDYRQAQQLLQTAATRPR